jgi:hypothetical protein
MRRHVDVTLRLRSVRNDRAVTRRKRVFGDSGCSEILPSKKEIIINKSTKNT